MRPGCPHPPKTPRERESVGWHGPRCGFRGKLATHTIRAASPELHLALPHTQPMTQRACIHRTLAVLVLLHHGQSRSTFDWCYTLPLDCTDLQIADVILPVCGTIPAQRPSRTLRVHCISAEHICHADLKIFSRASAGLASGHPPLRSDGSHVHFLQPRIMGHR